MAAEERVSGSNLFVCPQCNGALRRLDSTLACTLCAQTFRMMEFAYADFAPEASFDDHWVRDPVARKAWLEVEAPREEEYEVGLARRYLKPLLASLGHEPGKSVVLSAGCGMGSDVDVLSDAGYATWGIDIGNRVLCWHQRKTQSRLARADIRSMPFRGEQFDFVLSLNTLEHIGVIGDSIRVAPDYLDQRRRALRSLLRVLKPGGHLLLSGLSRSIPFDFGHVQDHGFVRIHSPWERFLLDYSDVRKLCRESGEVARVTPLPLRGFFSWTRLRHSPIARPFLPFVEWVFGGLPQRVYGWGICPFWIALARKRSPDEPAPDSP